jgi:hypothetical protein
MRIVPFATERSQKWNTDRRRVRLSFQSATRSVTGGTPRTMERTEQRSNPTERELASTVDRRLRSLLPRTWSVEPIRPGPGDDLVIAITAPDGRSARLLVEVKSLVDAKSVPALVERFARAGDESGVVIARYLSPRTRTALEEKGLSYADATGNIRLVLDEPGLAVVVAGADRDPFRGPERPTNSLRGLPAARVARALVDRRPPWRMRELAEYSGASLGSTARMIDFLDREALVRRDDAGSVEEVDWVGILRRWSDDYELTKRRSVTRALASRGVDAIEEGLRGSAMNYAVSGSLAARLVAPEAEARLGLVYAEDPDDVLAAVRARPSTGATNLLVIEPADDTPFVRSVDNDGVRYAALSQVAVDLLSGPGRMPEEGDALLSWMVANEDRWRA